jgi:hypothetical protein
MAEFSFQGTLSTSGTVIATGAKSTTTLLNKVTILRFNNSSAYTLQLYKYEASSATTTLIYNLTLSAGDTVTDNLIYALNPGDYLKAYSNITGTTYYAYGISN